MVQVRTASGWQKAASESDAWSSAEAWTLHVPGFRACSCCLTSGTAAYLLLLLLLLHCRSRAQDEGHTERGGGNRGCGVHGDRQLGAAAAAVRCSSAACARAVSQGQQACCMGLARLRAAGAVMPAARAVANAAVSGHACVNVSCKDPLHVSCNRKWLGV